MMLKELSDRQKRILSIIVESYIGSAEPVGSRTVADETGLGLSSATIRNEMAELEEKGWLEQPHTSAGRIPTVQGYRAYVDTMMRRYHLTQSELSRTAAFLRSHIIELEGMILEAGRIVSELSGYPTLAMSPRFTGSVLSCIDLIYVNRNQFVLVLVTAGGVIKSRVCYSEEQIVPEALSSVAARVERVLLGHPIRSIPPHIVASLVAELGEHEHLLALLLESINEVAKELECPSVAFEGGERLLNYPEYRDVDKTKDFLAFLKDTEMRRQVLSPAEGRGGITVTIGKEHPLDQLRESSVVMGNYKIGGRSAGVIAVIGPTRMEYSRVLGQLEYFVKELDQLLAHLFDEEPISSERGSSSTDERE